MTNHKNRRNFIKSALYLSAGLVMSASTFVRLNYAQAKSKKLDLSGKNPKQAACVGMAKGLNYVHDAVKAEKAGEIKRTERNGIKPKDQICKTCSFYTQKEAAEGPCTLINPQTECHVAANGYCNSWVPRT